MSGLDVAVGDEEAKQWPPALYRFWARAVSFVVAAAVAIGILGYPQAVAAVPDDLRRSVLIALLVGMAGGFVHGVGYVPVHAIPRIVLGPLVAWPLLTVGLIALWRLG